MTVSRELIVTFQGASARNIGNLEIPRVLSQLEKLVLTSGALLQSINKSFLDNSTINHRSKRWLSGEEPKACLAILKQMVNMTGMDTPKETVVNLEGSNHFEEPCPHPSEDKINDVIALFHEQRNHFRFLLTANVE